MAKDRFPFKPDISDDLIRCKWGYNNITPQVAD
jgi:hypothetical protein